DVKADHEPLKTTPKTDSVLCENCGEPAKTGNIFCKACGNRLGSKPAAIMPDRKVELRTAVAPEPAVVVDSEYQTIVPPLPKQNSIKPTLLAVLGIVAVI